MEDDILKEQNKQKRDLLLKEEKVRNYISADSDFQNLTILPSSIYSIERVVNMYMAVDTTSSSEISENILTGLFRYMVADISGDLNGIVLHSDGTINEEASEKQEEEILEAEKATAFYRDDDNDNVKAFREMVDEFIDKKPKEDYIEEIKKPEEPMVIRGDGNTKDSAELEEKKKEEYDREENIRVIASNVIAAENKNRENDNEEKITELPEKAIKLINNVVEVNEHIISLVDSKKLDSEKFKSMPPQYQNMIIKYLGFELYRGNPGSHHEKILEIIETLEPKYEKNDANKINNDILANRVVENDNILKLAVGKSNLITELDKSDMMSKKELDKVIDNVEKSNDLYFSSGRPNYLKFKETYGDGYVKAAIEENKKRALEQLAFNNPKRFEEQKSTKIIGLYKHYLIEEAEKINPNRKDDPEFWKEIVAKDGTFLYHLENMIKDNSQLLSEFMMDDLNIDFNKVAEAQEPNKRFIDIFNEANERFDDIEKKYPEIRENIFEQIKNIEKSDNKEEEIKKIRGEIVRLPKELFYMDFYANKDYSDYVEKYDKELTDLIDKGYTKKFRELKERKKEISENQQKKYREENKSEKTEEGRRKLSQEDKKRLRERLLKTKNLHPPKVKSATFHKIDEEKGPKKYRVVESKNVRGLKDVSRQNSGKRVTKLKMQDDKTIAIVDKGITGATSLSKYMAKPKMIVDEIEIPVGGDTNSEKTSNTVETLLKEQGLVAKFKSVEGDLTVEEYASKMGEILKSINDKIKDGSIPKELNIDGSIKATTLKDIVSMSFENTEILLENLPNDISEMTKEDIEKAIKDQINDKIKEDKEKESRKQSETKQEEIEPKEDVKENLEPDKAEKEEKTPEEKEKEIEEREEKENVTASKVNGEKEEFSQKQLEERLKQEQADRTRKIEEEKKAKEEIKDSVEDVKEEDSKGTALVQDTFFNRVKRRIMDNKVVQKFAELFGGKKENKDISESITAVESKNDNTEKDIWGEIEDKEGAARKALEDHEAKKQKVGVATKEYEEQEK